MQKRYRDKKRDSINAKERNRYWVDPAKTRARSRELAMARRVEKAGRPPGERCEICNGLFSAAISKNNHQAHWDHNHATDEFRGWLCADCNKALGLFKDLPDNLLAAAVYLRKRGFAAG